MTHEVIVRFRREEDARAFAELAREVGEHVSCRVVCGEPVHSPPLTTRIGKLAYSAFADGRSKHREEIQELFLEHGYAAESANTTLTRLVRNGDLTRVHAGVYRKEEKK